MQRRTKTLASRQFDCIRQITVGERTKKRKRLLLGGWGR